MPIEVTFIDENNTVRYFNKPEKIIFVRSKAVIGRKVQNCHPAKSLDTVNAIVESFRSGKKNVAEFWINMAARMVHIRFFAVRDPQGKYLGTMEVGAGRDGYPEACWRKTAFGLASVKP